MTETRGKELELEITNMAHGGVAVARHDGRVIFVSDTIPGERVLARVTEESKKSFWRAETLSVIRPSEHRVDHVWSAAAIDRDPADRAGGAEYGHIDLAHQRELKRFVLTDSLSRMAKQHHDVTVEALPQDEDNRGTKWRTRVRLHVDADGRLGPFAARSHRVIPVDDLPLATAEIADAAPLAQRFVGEESVELLSPSTGGVRMIVGDQKPSVIREVVGEREFRLTDTGFWQVHRRAAATLTSAVQEAIDEAIFDPRAANLDLYGGVGLLAAAVGDRFGATVRITSVESDPRATEHAADNLSDWVGASAVTARTERFLSGVRSSLTATEKARYRSSTVVLDPPRAGAGREVVDSLAMLAPAQVVYVACDPVAFARDVAFFAGHGYRLARLRAFDLFPNTHHVEAVGTLVRD
jgi:tRNA/tmRNA/rRNA uracil-C5-methylase (TrmA/RlmC/RlmD family)